MMVGYCFKSNCDTEVILYTFAKWGIESFAMFNGMFAIAVYDVVERKLTLARGRIGKNSLLLY